MIGLIIRHGEPYYPTDSLTEKGEREAALLGERLLKEHVTHAYVSPLGRAKKTAAPFLHKSGMEATELPWLRELPIALPVEYAYECKFGAGQRCPWNVPPQIWTAEPDIFTPDGWRRSPRFGTEAIRARYALVQEGWDALLASHGYVREGAVYRVGDGWEEKEETLALFCHLGLGNMLLSQILGLSLVAVWHTLYMPTSSVTTVFMERHRADLPVAHARLVSVGDTSHLYAGGEPVSASGLFADRIR